MNPERVYRLLLRAFPREFREDVGGEMTALFRARHREGGSGGSARAIADGMGMGLSDPPEMTIGPSDRPEVMTPAPWTCSARTFATPCARCADRPP